MPCLTRSISIRVTSTLISLIAIITGSIRAPRIHLIVIANDLAKLLAPHALPIFSPWAPRRCSAALRCGCVAGGKKNLNRFLLCFGTPLIPLIRRTCVEDIEVEFSIETHVKKQLCGGPNSAHFMSKSKQSFGSKCFAKSASQRADLNSEFQLEPPPLQQQQPCC